MNVQEAVDVILEGMGTLNPTVLYERVNTPLVPHTWPDGREAPADGGPSWKVMFSLPLPDGSFANGYIILSDVLLNRVKKDSSLFVSTGRHFHDAYLSIINEGWADRAREELAAGKLPVGDGTDLPPDF